MAARRALIALGFAAAAAGCQVPQRVPPVLVVGTTGVPSPDGFARLLEAARASGYEVYAEDLEHGTFRARSRYADRNAPIGSHAFVVQAYGSGHVEVIAIGPRVEPIEGDYLMPPALRRELVALALALAR